MSWAGRRRLIILIIIGAVVVAFLLIFSISVFYKAPSCSDGVQNQGESGIDCGGPCAYLCTEQEQAPTVLFTKAVSNGQGRLDAVAEVENKNAAAARNVPYTITFYGTNQIEVGAVSGVLDLPPNATVPVFVPGVATGNLTVTGAFLTIDSSLISWYSMPVDTRVVPSVSGTHISGSTSSPHIEATLSNGSNAPLSNVRAIVFVRDGAGNIIDASATVVENIPAQGSATALFTWNAPFSGVPALIEVTPVIPLP